jgi:hypothetical protein
MSRNEYTRLRLIADAEERNEFVALECGRVHWCPQSAGAISSHQLRWIADELDRRNAEWSPDQVAVTTAGILSLGLDRNRLRTLERAVRGLLDGVNARYPDKHPREWSCPHMAELDRLVPPVTYGGEL